MFDLPSLTNVEYIGVDIETYDPDIKTSGIGVRRDGYIIGISVAVPDGRSWYLPIAHELGFNFEKEKIKTWAINNLCNHNQLKIGANFIYDLDYFHFWGVKIPAPYYDVQIAEALLEPNKRKFNLDSLCQKYLNVGKYEEELELYALENFGKKASVKPNLYRMPSNIVAEYAKMDALYALRIYEKQKGFLKKQKLESIANLEMSLIPLLLGMKQRGVRVDIEKATKLNNLLIEKADNTLSELKKITGYDINPNASESIKVFCDVKNIQYDLTKKSGKPSFSKKYLEDSNNEVLNLILKYREYAKMQATFTENYVNKYAINGRIHCDFNQLRSDKFGTVSGRFSSTNPNLQNVPARTKLGKEIRKIFVPEIDEVWHKLDYSQIEPRLTMHYGIGQKVQQDRQIFITNKTVDAYQGMITALPHLPRATIKTLYLGITYGMGKKMLSERLNISLMEGKKLIEDFKNAVPYIDNLSNRVVDKINRFGSIRTLLGRSRVFDSFESVCMKFRTDFNTQQEFEKYKKNNPPLDYENAIKKYGIVKRAKTYVGLNALIQGSAADVMKKAMVDVYRSGVLSVLGFPLLTIHDELDFSAPKTKAGMQAIREVQHIMETTVKLKLPLSVDIESGETWGDVQ